MRLIRNYTLLLLVIAGMFSCKKKDVIPEPLPDTSKEGMLVLHEGLFNQNNSSLNWLDLSTGEMSEDLFLKVNNRLLGDVANKMIAYGGKIYISVTTSSTVEIIHKKTFKSLQQLAFNYQNKSQQPRSLVGYKNSVFVTSYDGYVTEIDTTTLQIKSRLKVGKNPEGICVYNGDLYVANSGGLDAPNYDNTVLRLSTFPLAIQDTFVVGNNPIDVVSDSFGNIYVAKRGDYSNDPSELIKITPTGDIIPLGIPATTLSIQSDILYICYYDFNSGNAKVSTYNCTTQSTENDNFISGSNFTTLYGIIPFKTNEVIGLDAMNYTNSGYIRFFKNGQISKNFKVGLNPNSIIYYE